MILPLIILISIFQTGLYLLSDKINLKHGKIIVFLSVLMGHFFVFPRFFHPDPDPNGINCGLPILGITLAFWILGGGATIVVHAIYYFARRMNSGAS